MSLSDIPTNENVIAMIEIIGADCIKSLINTLDKMFTTGTFIIKKNVGLCFHEISYDKKILVEATIDEKKINITSQKDNIYFSVQLKTFRDALKPISKKESFFIYVMADKISISSCYNTSRDNFTNIKIIAKMPSEYQIQKPEEYSLKINSILFSKTCSSLNSNKSNIKIYADKGWIIFSNSNMISSCIEKYGELPSNVEISSLPCKYEIPFNFIKSIMSAVNMSNSSNIMIYYENNKALQLDFSIGNSGNLNYYIINTANNS